MSTEKTSVTTNFPTDTSTSSPDLTLVNSPMKPDYGSKPKADYEVLPPMGLAYLATACKKNGHSVEIIDAEQEGLDAKKLATNFNSRTAGMVGINLLTPTLESAIVFARNLDPSVPLVIGGPHATALPKRTLQNFVKVHLNTILVSGEAEISMTRILRGDSILDIPGVWSLSSSGEIKIGANMTLSEIPTPMVLDHNFLSNDPSIDEHTKQLETRILTSRGCPFDCTYCAGARSALNIPVRQHSLEVVLEEMRQLFDQYGRMGVRFIDDLFIASEKRVINILTAVERKGLPMAYWDATGRANILANFSNHTLDFLRDHNAHEVAMGIESGSERLRKKIKKEVTYDQIMSAVTRLIQRDIAVKGYFIVGLPTETAIETEQTINLAKQLAQKSNGLFRASIFAFRPYPGTKEWSNLIESGYTIDQLLAMHASGEGSISKHSVTTNLSFAEVSPQKLAEKIRLFSNYQLELLGKK